MWPPLEVGQESSATVCAAPQHCWICLKSRVQIAKESNLSIGPNLKLFIHHPRYGTAVIRDQKPMSDGGLVRALQDGLKPRDWYRILNKKVFFWLTRERLETLVNAREYREEPAVDYLVLNVVSLVFHVEEVGGQLTNMNDAVFKIQTL
jgi:hypothetical protein